MSPHTNRQRAVFALTLALVGCSLSPRRDMPPQKRPSPVPVAAVPPIDPAAIADAVPRSEPRSTNGNPAFYTVFGKRYFVRASAGGYLERGVASWYGPGFHAIRTSNGETYDMYGMTAAHKTLPLPCYVRVTNLANNRSVVLRVNDRGPFVGNRIIDLSYTAAAKLDMLKNGTALVEVRSLDPDAPLRPVATALPPAGGNVGLYVQAGAFADRANADRLAARLRDRQIGVVSVTPNALPDRTLYRVRVGPVSDVPAFDRLVHDLSLAGVDGATLAFD
jgi:rare lipoprotein A